jgi:hypothetical protein
MPEVSTPFRSAARAFGVSSGRHGQLALRCEDGEGAAQNRKTYSRFEFKNEKHNKFYLILTVIF